MAILRKVSSKSECCQTRVYMKWGFRKNKPKSTALRTPLRWIILGKMLVFLGGFCALDYSSWPVSVKISFAMHIHLPCEGRGEERGMTE